LDALLVLPAVAIGLSVGVLNLNNMRDEASDRKSNKNTIVVKLVVLKLKYTITV
jgi:1,4-dihydroxy-2-naphthoate octaprenyltransferase